MTTGEKQDLSTIQKLGNEWELENFGIIFKKYPCCAYTHRSIDAVLELIQSENISPEEVERVEVIAHYKVPAVLIYPNAKNALEGKFSMQYCLAAALLDQEITLETFTDYNVNRNGIQKIMKRITMRVDKDQKVGSDPKEKTATVKVITKKKALKNKVNFPLGHPYNPFTESDMYEKFSMCLEKSYSKSVINSLYDSLSSLDNHKFSSIEEKLY
jgi:2-methylcitrate dehydratase PrpD